MREDANGFSWRRHRQRKTVCETFQDCWLICQSCENVCHANFLLRDADKAEAVDEAAGEGLDIPEGCQEKVAESEEVEEYGH